MDPITAIGLASSIVAFIDFGYELIYVAREVHGSAAGSTTENERIGFLNDRLEATATELSAATRTTSSTTAAERRLGELSEECLRLSRDLRRLLEKIKAEDPRSKRQLIASVLRDVRKKDEKKDLEARLDRCRAQLHLQLSQTSWLESMRRLDVIASSGQCRDRELESLKQQVTALQLALDHTKPGSDLLKDIESLLDRPRKAVDKVLQNRILEALEFEEMHRRYDSIEEAHIDTFRWLLDDPEPLPPPVQDRTSLSKVWVEQHLEEEQPLRLRAQKQFLDWLKCGQGIFHISGKPGAGKSTLMKYLAESPKTKLYLESWAAEKSLVFASFYFWRHGTNYQKSLEGLLRSLLYSVLTQCPELLSTIFPAQWKAAHDGFTIRFGKSEVLRSFDKLMKQPEIHRGRKLAFFIDGLDEFEGQDSSLVSALLDYVHSGLHAVKICVSSRELPIFQQRFSAYPNFRLHEVTYHDIFAFVNERLQNNEDVKSARYELGKTMVLGRQLVEKAEGVFLWVTLALRALEQGLLNGDSFALLTAKIDFLPTEVEELFNNILNSIQKQLHPIERRRAMRTLAIVTRCVPKMTLHDHGHYLYEAEATVIDLLELSFLDEYETDPNFSANFQGYLSDREIEIRLERCHKLVNSSCMGLVSVTSTHDGPEYSRFRSHSALLAHRSLVDFFENSEVRALIDRDTKDFDIFHFFCQSLLAEIKVSVSSYFDQFQLARDSEGNLFFKSKAPLPKTVGNLPSPNELTSRDEYFVTVEFELDLRWIISIYSTTRDADVSTLLSTFDQLSKLADTEFHPTPPPFGWTIDSPREWANGCLGVTQFTNMRCLASDICRWRGFALGIAELWLDASDVDVGVGTTPSGKNIMLQVVTHSLLMVYWESSDAHSPGSPTFSKSLQTITFALAKGASPNAEPLDASRLLNESYPDNITHWHFLIWHSIMTTEPGVPIQALWLLFLVHGADTNFRLSFSKHEDSEDSQDNDQQGRLLSMSGEFGRERRMLFTPVKVAEDYGGIVELAKGQDGAVSLRDIASFWFPDYAEEFRNLIDLNESRVGDPSAGELRDLRQKYGFDLDSWPTREWKVPKPLLRSWSGVSKIIE